MKKISLLLALILVISIPLQAYAVESRDVWNGPNLSFSGTTAECSLKIYGDYSSDYIVVTLKLFQGNNLVKQWSKGGSGVVSISETWPVTKGLTYTLTGEVMINGTYVPTHSDTGTC